MIWQYNSNGIYSTQSLYKIINFRGVQPVFVSAVWGIKVPPRVHFFLWLLSKNTVLTRDNLSVSLLHSSGVCSLIFSSKFRGFL